MTSRDFCYWLQGIFEVAQPTELNAQAVEKIRAHLALVFRHEIDPSMGDVKQQTDLDAIHHGPFPPSMSGVKMRC